MKKFNLIAIAAVICSSTLQAQMSQQATPPPAMGDPSFQGSVPQGDATSTAIPLTLADAINKASRQAKKCVPSACGP